MRRSSCPVAQAAFVSEGGALRRHPTAELAVGCASWFHPFREGGDFRRSAYTQPRAEPRGWTGWAGLGRASASPSERLSGDTRGPAKRSYPRGRTIWCRWEDPCFNRHPELPAIHGERELFARCVVVPASGFHGSFRLLPPRACQTRWTVAHQIASLAGLRASGVSSRLSAALASHGLGMFTERMVGDVCWNLCPLSRRERSA